MSPEVVSAPFEAFRKGVCQIRGYCASDEGDRISLAFEPWFTEPDRMGGVPCLRLDFRRVGDRVLLERFVVCDRGEERPMDLEAAHDALQAWLDAVSDYPGDGPGARRDRASASRNAARALRSRVSGRSTTMDCGAVRIAFPATGEGYQPTVHGGAS